MNSPAPSHLAPAKHPPSFTNPTPSPSLSTEEAAHEIGIQPVTLRAWKGQRTGPPYIQVTARCVRYLRTDIAKFIADRRVVPSPRILGVKRATLRQTRQAA